MNPMDGGQLCGRHVDSRSDYGKNPSDERRDVEGSGRVVVTGRVR